MAEQYIYGGIEDSDIGGQLNITDTIGDRIVYTTSMGDVYILPTFTIVTGSPDYIINKLGNSSIRYDSGTTLKNDTILGGRDWKTFHFIIRPNTRSPAVQLHSTDGNGNTSHMGYLYIPISWTDSVNFRNINTDWGNNNIPMLFDTKIYCIVENGTLKAYTDGGSGYVLRDTIVMPYKYLFIFYSSIYNDNVITYDMGFHRYNLINDLL